jgi:hypothetical protein
MPEPATQKDKGIFYFQTANLEIINRSGALMHIDGDPAETPEQLKIEVAKRCFRLIQPQ